MTTASRFFLPGADGSPPMFGPEGYARDFTPKCGRYSLVLSSDKKTLLYNDENSKDFRDNYTACDICTVDRCMVAAMGWIRSKGYGIVIASDGDIALEHPTSSLDKLNPVFTTDHANQLLDAARWVCEQEK